MGGCASKSKVLVDKLRDKPRHAPSRSTSKSNGGVPPSPSTKKVASMNKDKHISSDSAIFNQKSMYSSTQVEDRKKYGDMRKVIMTRKEDDDNGKKYGDKDDEQDDESDEGGEDGENDQEMSMTSEDNEEDDEDGDEFEDEQVTTMTQKDGHDDDEVRDEDESVDKNCDKKEKILNRRMNEYVGEDEVEEEENDKYEIIVTQKDDEIEEEDVGEKQVVPMQKKNKYEDVDLKSSIGDRKNQMDDISPRKLHDSPSSKIQDNDHDHNVNINLHAKDNMDTIEEDRNIFTEKGDANKSELHATTPAKQRVNEDPKIKSTSSKREVEEESIKPIKSPPPTYNNKSVVIEAANPTVLQTIFSSSPAKPTKDVVVLDQHPTLHPTMVLKNPLLSLTKKDVVAKGAPKEKSTNRSTNTAISSTFAF